MSVEIEKILNAMRIGVVPGASLGSLMVGRDKEINEFRRILDNLKDGEGRFKFIEGAYGSGKSFLLKYMEEIAITEGFVVSSLTISSSFDFSRLDYIYAAMMGRLKINAFENTGTSFEEIFENWLTGLKQGSDMTHASKSIYRVIQELNAYNTSFASVLLVYIRARISHDLELARIAAAWIKGDKNLPYQLKKRLEVKGNIDKDNALEILRGFNLLIKLMGYKGLVVLVDEAELIMNERSDVRMKAYNNIRQFVDITGLGEFPSFGMLFAGTPSFFNDEEKGIKSYTALADRLGVKEDSKYRELDGKRQPIMSLVEMNKNEYLELIERITHLHEQKYGYVSLVTTEHLYGLTMSEARLAYGVQKLTIRHFLKKLIEVLDLMEAHPELPIFKVNHKISTD